MAKFHARGAGAALTLLATVAHANTDVLTYRSVLAASRSHALSVRMAEHDVRQAAASRDLATYADDPRLSLNAGLGVSYKDRTAGSGGDVSREQSYGIQMEMPVYDFGRNQALVAQREAELGLARLDKDEADETLQWTVAAAYLDLLTAARTLRVTTEQVRVAKNKVTVQTRNYNEGLRPESDVVTARVDLGRAEIAQSKAKDDLQTAELRLKALSGMTSLPPLAQSALEPQPPTHIAKTVATWSKAGPTLAERRNQLSDAVVNADFEALRAARRPSLDAVVSASERGGWAPLRTEGAGQLRLSWTIPWPGMNRLEEARIALRRQNIALASEAVARSQQETTEVAGTALAATERLWSALAEQLKLAERQRQLVQNRYDSGLASALDVTTAETTVLAIRLDQVRASHEATQAALSIAKTRGIAQVEALFP